MLMLPLGIKFSPYLGVTQVHSCVITGSVLGKMQNVMGIRIVRMAQTNLHVPNTILVWYVEIFVHVRGISMCQPTIYCS